MKKQYHIRATEFSLPRDSAERDLANAAIRALGTASSGTVWTSVAAHEKLLWGWK